MRKLFYSSEARTMYQDASFFFLTFDKISVEHKPQKHVTRMTRGRISQ